VTSLYPAPRLPRDAVIRLAVPPTHEAARERFWRLRRASNLALLAWLKEQPPPADVALECDASVSTIRQLATLSDQAVP
jgi:hypothetical protein